MRARAAIAAGLVVLIAASLFTGVGSITADAEGLWLVAVAARPAPPPRCWRARAASPGPRPAALLAGAGLAVAGVIMQMLARNRFVEPTTAGTAQAAGLGLVVVTLVAPGSALWLKMLAATAAALVGTAGFLALVRRLPPQEPLLVPLTGLVYGGILGAATTFLAFERDLLQFLDIWMNGEFSGVLLGRYEFLWAAGAASALAFVYAGRFTIAGLGEDASLNLGLRYGQVMAFGLALVSVITAVTVVTVGMIPFVGLVVPNIVSRLRGDNLSATLPLVALSGAALVLACDILARLLRYPYEIPVGTVLGVLGAGLFLWLLHGRPAHGRG
ncbi:iron chelate uptake ABC transporter family permease subunit [Roseivivax marinus]|uniref:ABC transporter permease n=1 Tax=Roseivivax marinus TaxID=1379903 RepID=UPI001F04E121|nr:iron chelate uptake ABC transporter family permease subunit [Roseivivax marinus]UMA63611.1 iron chelate uptake ABC transporter family permease subunit [Roseivivax marinus]